MKDANTTSSAKAQREISLRALRFFASLRETPPRKTTISIIACLLLAQTSFAQRTERHSNNLPAATPESVGMSSERLAEIDEAVAVSLARKDNPDAVGIVVRKGRVE